MSSFKRKLLWFLALILGATIALVTLIHNLKSVLDTHFTTNGNWRINTGLGTENAGLHVNAAVAVGALLALKQSEAIYFAASNWEGEPLSNKCHYQISGNHQLSAGWWSITVYGQDRLLIPNGDRRYSFNSHDVQSADNGTFTIDLAPERIGSNWLPTMKNTDASFSPPWYRRLIKMVTPSDQFHLLLRIYKPDETTLASPESAVIPRIRKVKC